MYLVLLQMMKQKRKQFIQRLIAALIVLLLPSIVNLIMRNIASNANSTFATCWTAAAEDEIEIPDSGDDGTWKTNTKKN
jgi:hypothetical protein